MSLRLFEHVGYFLVDLFTIRLNNTLYFVFPVPDVKRFCHRRHVTGSERPVRLCVSAVSDISLILHKIRILYCRIVCIAFLWSHRVASQIWLNYQCWIFTHGSLSDWFEQANFHYVTVLVASFLETKYEQDLWCQVANLYSLVLSTEIRSDRHHYKFHCRLPFQLFRLE